MKLSPRELAEFSKHHLCYEINTLCAAVYVLARMDRSEPRDGFSLTVENIYAEAILLHSRSLFEFLFDDKTKYPDDSRAFHFFDCSESWKSIRPQESELLTKAFRRAGKEIVHLTYSRLQVDLEEKKWKLNSIANEIVAVVSIFAEKASPNKIHPDVHETVKHWGHRIRYEPAGAGLGEVVGATTMSGFVADAK